MVVLHYTEGPQSALCYRSILRDPILFTYIFFDDGLRTRFVEFVQARGVRHTEEPDPMGTSVIGIPEDVDEALYETIEAYYEELSAMQEQLLDGTTDGLEINRAGVRVTLSDGRPCMVRLDPEIVRRLLTVLSFDELQDLVATIARAAEDPDDGPCCAR
jgi:hypothetical protein